MPAQLDYLLRFMYLIDDVIKNLRSYLVWKVGHVQQRGRGVDLDLQIWLETKLIRRSINKVKHIVLVCRRVRGLSER